MFCSKCGSEIAEGSAFCGKCGAPMGVQAGGTAPAGNAQSAVPGSVVAEALAAEALAQIEARAYDAEAAGSGAGILRYGTAFSGKSLAVAVERRPS